MEAVMVMRLAVGLPETVEHRSPDKESHSYRVAGRIFAAVDDGHLRLSVGTGRWDRVPLADLTRDEARAMLLAAWRRHAPQSALATLAAEQVPLDRHRLAGYWNDDLVYSGAMENMVLFLGRDGRGCFAWENFGGSHGCVLAWSLEGDRLTTRTVREFSSMPGNGIPMDLDAVLVSVGMEGGPYGTRPLVLRIDGPRGFPFPDALGYAGPRCPERLWRWVGRARK